MQPTLTVHRLSRITLLVFAVVLSATLVSAAFARDYTEVIVFGDSLSDPGNLFAVTGGAIPPSPYFEGRFSNGPVWAELLADALDVPMRNYAFGGARTGRTNQWDDPSVPVEFPGLLDEIDLFLATNQGRLDPRALYVVWAGANDFFEAPAAATIPAAVTNITTAVRRLQIAGARSILVPNMPDLGSTPEGLASGFSPILSVLSIMFNVALDDALEPGPHGRKRPSIIVDVFELFRRVIAHPSEFELTDVTSACLDLTEPSVCVDPDAHLFWDSVHPTTTGHRILAEQFRRAARAHIDEEAARAIRR